MQLCEVSTNLDFPIQIAEANHDMRRLHGFAVFLWVWADFRGFRGKKPTKTIFLQFLMEAIPELVSILRFCIIPFRRSTFKLAT